MESQIQESKALNPKLQKFVYEYCTNGFNALSALEVSGIPKDGKRKPALQAYHLTRDPQVVRMVKEFLDQALEPYRARLEYEVMEIYYKRATYQVQTFYEDSGAIKPLSQIPPEWHCCIDGVTTKLWGAEGIPLTSYELPNRDTALQTLLKLTREVEGDVSGFQLPAEARNRLKTIWETIPEAKIPLKFPRAPGRPRKVN